MTVHVSSILQRKGREVVTVHPDVSVIEAVRTMRDHNIGAVVVSPGEGAIAGIMSERDVVRRLATEGATCLDHKVAEIMTTRVTSCAPEDTADHLMQVMTEGRFRHLPVVEDGRMVGVISIGDVVKSYVNDLEVKAESLEEYVTRGG